MHLVSIIFAFLVLTAFGVPLRGLFLLGVGALTGGRLSRIGIRLVGLGLGIVLRMTLLLQIGAFLIVTLLREHGTCSDGQRCC